MWCRIELGQTLGPRPQHTLLRTWQAEWCCSRGLLHGEKTDDMILITENRRTPSCRCGGLQFISVNSFCPQNKPSLYLHHKVDTEAQRGNHVSDATQPESVRTEVRGFQTPNPFLCLTAPLLQLMPRSPTWRDRSFSALSQGRNRAGLKLRGAGFGQQSCQMAIPRQAIGA